MSEWVNVSSLLLLFYTHSMGAGLSFLVKINQLPRKRRDSTSIISSSAINRVFSVFLLLLLFVLFVVLLDVCLHPRHGIRSSDLFARPPFDCLRRRPTRSFQSMHLMHRPSPRGSGCTSYVSIQYAHSAALGRPGLSGRCSRALRGSRSPAARVKWTMRHRRWGRLTPTWTLPS